MRANFALKRVTPSILATKTPIKSVVDQIFVQSQAKQIVSWVLGERRRLTAQQNTKRAMMRVSVLLFSLLISAVPGNAFNRIFTTTFVPTPGASIPFVTGTFTAFVVDGDTTAFSGFARNLGPSLAPNNCTETNGACLTGLLVSSSAEGQLTNHRFPCRQVVGCTFWTARTARMVCKVIISLWPRLRTTPGWTLNTPVTAEEGAPFLALSTLEQMRSTARP